MNTAYAALTAILLTSPPPAPWEATGAGATPAAPWEATGADCCAPPPASRCGCRTAPGGVGTCGEYSCPANGGGGGCLCDRVAPVSTLNAPQPLYGASSYPADPTAWHYPQAAQWPPVQPGCPPGMFPTAGGG